MGCSLWQLFVQRRRNIVKYIIFIAHKYPVCIFHCDNKGATGYIWAIVEVLHKIGGVILPESYGVHPYTRPITRTPRKLGGQLLYANPT